MSYQFWGKTLKEGEFIRFILPETCFGWKTCLLKAKPPITVGKAHTSNTETNQLIQKIWL